MTSSHGVSDAASADLVVVRRRHAGRWATTAIVVAVGGLSCWSVLTNPRFEWPVVGHYLRNISIGRGLLVTLELTSMCMLLGVVLGTFLAVGRLSPNPIVRGASFAYVWFFRGTPVLVQLLFWFNLAALYPELTFGIPGVALDANQMITPMTAAVLGLGLNEAAYMAEIVRAGILSVDRKSVV